MADRKTSSQQEKPKEGNAVTRFIRRLSPTKKYHGPTSGASSATQGETSSSKQQNSAEATKKPNKNSLNLVDSKSNSSSKSNLSNYSPPSPWMTPAPSYQSLHQDERSTELKLLSQLHSNFDEATGILGKYISLRERKK